MLRDNTSKVVLIGGILIILFGAVAPNWIVNQFMFGFSRALAILGLLVLWRTGLVSFGHAFYFGLGAYTVAILDIQLGVTDVFVRLLGGAFLAGLAGFLVGFIMRNYRDIFFAMLNTAISMVLYGIIVKTESLGSTDGFAISLPTIFGVAPETKYPLFVVITSVAIVSALLINFYLKTTIGRLTTPIRDNEIRVEYLGFSVAHAIHLKYTMSAILAGGAGALMAMSLGQVDPDSMINWTVSGELVFITILSGPGNVIAPFIGSLVFEVLRTYAFELAPHLWQLIVGGTFLTIIFFLPGGIWSLISKLGRNKS
ncbi:MAG: branched-chain amino acid ABC transporter permease [Proteobacteria bacterium]|nr:branched-chain amino acid ABC transporter permease [Pseudomonadota bacterium]